MIALLIALACAQDSEPPIEEPEPVEQMTADLDETQQRIDEIGAKLDALIEALEPSEPEECDTGETCEATEPKPLEEPS